MTTDTSLCPACGRPVEEGWESCPACGEPLTLSSRVVVDRVGRPEPRWLARSRQRAGELKAMGEEASMARLGSLQQVDAVREREQANAARARARGDRQTLAVSGIAVVLFVVLVLVLAVANLR